MTAEAPDPTILAPEPIVLAQEPSAIQSFVASVAAVSAKESRWRMRGRRAFVVVTVYLALLSLLVVGVYRLMYDRAVAFNEFAGPFPGGGFDGGMVAGSMSADIGRAIFIIVLVLQTLLTLLLAPALTSGAISIEREKQTLELLITTPVSTLGMVIGKLISSLAFVLLLILGSMPLMAVVFAFGGVAPEDVVRAYLMLFAVAFGLGALGMFCSALFKRTQVSTAAAYMIVLLLTIGSLTLHTFWLSSDSRNRDQFGEFRRPSAPAALLLLNPLVADLDLACTAIPEMADFTCTYIEMLRDRDFNRADPPRDSFWPRSALAFVVLGSGLVLATTQLIAPSRRIRRTRATRAAAELDGGA